MKGMNTLRKLATLAICGLTMLAISSCGTSSSVIQPLSGPHMNGPVYVMGSCLSKDDSGADAETCRALRERVHYGLMKRGMYAGSPSSARRKVNLTITYFRDVGGWARGAVGPMAGKDGLDATMDVIDNHSGKIIGSASASVFNASATDSTKPWMINQVSEQLVDFLASGG
ncbi:MAG: hypothetical protein K9M97_02765 [Akkermansiaceae bacterium]|nr:hypothetical protein [Akkermansiaceae bacterium]